MRERVPAGHNSALDFFLFLSPSVPRISSDSAPYLLSQLTRDLPTTPHALIAPLALSAFFQSESYLCEKNPFRVSCRFVSRIPFRLLDIAWLAISAS